MYEREVYVEAAFISSDKKEKKVKNEQTIKDHEKIDSSKCSSCENFLSSQSIFWEK